MNTGRLLCAIAAALCLAAPATARAADGATSKPIEILMPPTGAFIPSGPVIVAGRLPRDAGAVNLLLDGAPVAEVTRDAGTFSATLTPRPGPHTLEARAGELSATITFASGTGGQGAAPYRYHQPVLEGRCAECHAGIRSKKARAEAKTCTTCHRRQAVFFPVIHDPVKEGSCLVCHEPHGSTRPSFLVAETKTLCVDCHEPSARHAELGRSSSCHLCHNPHASMNPQLLYDIVK